MPFKSRKQSKACFATHGFGHKVDCHEWAKVTNYSNLKQMGGNMDIQSILGYQKGSPYVGNPYLDINTPNGLIDMSNAAFDLIGIDNKGNKKKMKAGRKNPYRFAGTVVRETPMQGGGEIPNPGYNLLNQATIYDALIASHSMKVNKKNGKFKGLIPLEDWNDDVMNYIDKFKFVRRKGEGYVKVRGRLEEAPSNYIEPPSEFTLQQGGVYPNMEAVNNANKNLRAWLRPQLGADNWLANNSVVARNPGDPMPQYEYPNGKPQPQAPRATTLPPGITADMIENTNMGYGYVHPQNGNWIPVDPQAIYSKYGQKPTPPPTSVPMNSMAKAYDKGGKNPYQQGGSIEDLYKYIMSDDGEEDYNEDYKNTENTAPTEEDVEQNTVNQPDPDDYDVALQAAMMQDEHQVTMGNPDWGAGRNPYAAPTPASPDAIGNPAKYAFQFFQNKGLPSHVAAGIVGNLIQESGNFRADVVTDDVKGDNGMSHGIAQWQKSRWPAFLGWAASTGKNPKDLHTQLEYVYHEANQRGDLQKTMSATTPEEAATIFAKNYERPAHVDQHRINYARDVYQQ